MPISPDEFKTGGALQGKVAASLLSAREAAAALKPGDRVGAFRVIRELGRGGMAIVYLAERDDGEYQQQVALKWMQAAQLDASGEALFRRERQALADLNHPNIARLLDGGRSEDGRPWFAMEYIDGERLDDHCVTAALPLHERLKLFLQMSSAVAFAHARGVIHRDIKPSNALVDADGSVKLLDFGIARLLDQSDDLGDAAYTPGFASPEQLRRKPATVASDVYQLGRLLGCLLSADREEQATLARSTVLHGEDGAHFSDDNHGSVATLSQSLPRDLSAILRRAQADQPEQRYASVDALADDVRAFLDHRPVQARPATTLYRARRFLQRHPLASVASVAALALLIGMATWFSLRLRDERDLARQQRDIAETERDRAEQQSAIAQSISDFMRVDLLSSIDPARSRGDEPTIREALDAASGRLDTRFADAPIELTRLRTTLADLYLDLGQPEASLREAEAALAASARTPDGDSSRDWARIALARSRLERNELDAAAALLPDQSPDPAAITDREHQRITVHQQLLRANVAARRGDNALSADIASRAHQNALAWLGKDSELATSAGLHAATFLIRAGDSQRARDLLQTLYDEALARYGEDHPTTLGIGQRLSSALLDLQRFDAALALCERLLPLRRRVQGDQHPYTLAMLKVAATALQELKRHDEAEAMFREVHATLERTLGSEHTRTLNAGNDLALLLSKAGKLDEAETLYRQNLTAKERAFGAGAVTTLATRHNLAQLLMKRDRLAQAEATEREAIQAARDLSEGDSPTLTALISGLAAIHEAQGRHLDADARWQESIDMQARISGGDHPRTQRLIRARDEARGKRSGSPTDS